MFTCTYTACYEININSNTHMHTYILQTRYPGHLMNTRGAGTFCAIDCENATIRDEFVKTARQKGTP